MNEGWGWERGMRKSHYFVDGVSLCGSWGERGFNFLNLYEEENPENPNKCIVCKKKKETFTG